MIITSDRCFTMQPPKLSRCFECKNGIYIVILQHIYTMEYYVIKVKDTMPFPLRFNFNLCLPECASYGTYDYFVVSYKEWLKDTNNINVNQIRKSGRQTLKTPVTDDGKLLVIGDSVFVTSYFKMKTGIHLPSGDELLSDEKDPDMEANGEILTSLNILSRGLLKYHNLDIESFEPQTKEYKYTEKVIKEYNG